MIFEFKITDNDGSILTQGREQVAQNFSMHDFLNKTVPGWEQTVKAFYNKTVSSLEGTGTQFVNQFATDIKLGGPQEPKDSEGARMAPPVPAQPAQAAAPAPTQDTPAQPNAGV